MVCDVAIAMAQWRRALILLQCSSTVHLWQKMCPHQGCQCQLRRKRMEDVSPTSLGEGVPKNWRLELGSQWHLGWTVYAPYPRKSKFGLRSQQNLGLAMQPTHPSENSKLDVWSEWHWAWVMYTSGRFFLFILVSKQCWTMLDSWTMYPLTRGNFFVHFRIEATLDFVRPLGHVPLWNFFCSF